MATITGTFTIHVNPGTPPPPPLALTPPSGALPDETEGQTVSTTEIAISGGVPPYTLEPVTGLPPGVNAAISADGTKVEITGTPTLAGDATVDITVKDSAA